MPWVAVVIPGLVTKSASGSSRTRSTTQIPLPRGIGATATLPRIRYVAPVPRDEFSHTAIADASPEVIFAALDEPATWEQIGGVDRVTDSVVDADGRLQGFSFEVRAAGKNYVGSATPIERVDGELVAWNVDTSEVRGTTTVALRPVDTSTEVTVVLEVESKGLLASMFFPVIAAAVGSGLPKSVDEFAARF